MTSPYQMQDPQYGHGQHPQAAYQQTYQPAPTQKGFFGRLFDFSFDHYVTTSIIKVIFTVIVVVHTLWILGFSIYAFSTSTAAGVTALLLAPITWFLAILFTRVWMELLVIIFKIKEDLGAIRGRGGF
ncbi:DUF4282 domain-containing protein [Streptosporangium sp. V21-05]|uniref:DUF4282 domain-containing protein n=1 Tax=Streptosporangium sp. V21-05 TaxID=3446115 RepID=UPI003F532215